MMKVFFRSRAGDQHIIYVGVCQVQATEYFIHEPQTFGLHCVGQKAFGEIQRDQMELRLQFGDILWFHRDLVIGSYQINV